MLIAAKIAKTANSTKFLFDIIVATVAGQFSAEKHNYNDITNSF